MNRFLVLTLAASLAAPFTLAERAQAQSPPDQRTVTPVTAIDGPALRFHWPAVQIGVGSYEEGPTGLTIFNFPNGATAVVDVRGGAPGTVNTDALRLGYDGANLNAIVFAGGSSYGEEAITAVATGLKDVGEADAGFGGIALVAGAILYDFRAHRLNEIYPDKRLARAAMTALRPGVFPLGAHGAGRMAMQGGYLGCGAHSGQGGAFRQIGDLKIAVFTVVNALGSIVDRSGQMVRCHRAADWPSGDGISALLARASPAAPPAAAPSPGMTGNTTLSLVVTNRKMSASELQRLAIQVHAGMARAIQPFSTADDGDTLYAVSTQEVDVPWETLDNTRLGVIAGELMWDAVLASVPADEPAKPRSEGRPVPRKQLERLVGRYDFGGPSPITVGLNGDRLTISSDGPEFFDIPHGAAVPLVPLSAREFQVAGRYRTRISFEVSGGGRSTGAVIDPGPWQQRGARIR